MNAAHFSRFTSILLCLLLTTASHAEELKINGFIYKTTSDSTVTLTGYTDNLAVKFTIPGQITVEEKTYDVTRIGFSAFESNDRLQSVIIGEKVTKIDRHAFFGCLELSSITFPENLAEIGEAAFMSCRKLTSLSLPPNLTSLGEVAFADCNGLISIVLPDNLTRLGHSLFYSCAELSSVTLPAGLTMIDSLAFAECGKLEAITIPGKVKRICDGAFSGTGLKSITIPANVETIESYVFDLTPLETITIPATVKQMEVGTNPFIGCRLLKTIYVEDGSPILSSADGILYTKGMQKLVTWPHAKADTAYSIPAPTAAIGTFAFRYNQTLQSLILPEGLTTIDSLAFTGADIESVVLPESLTEIGEYAFNNTRIHSIVIPDKVATIKSGAFHHTLLTNASIGKGLTRFGTNVFEGSQLAALSLQTTVPPAFDTTKYAKPDDQLRYLCLYVPKGTREAYSKAYPWNKAHTIVEKDGPVQFFPVTYTIDIDAPNNIDVRVYNKNGFSFYGYDPPIAKGDTIIVIVKDQSSRPTHEVTHLFMNETDIVDLNETSHKPYTFTYTIENVTDSILLDIRFTHPTGTEDIEMATTAVSGSQGQVIIHSGTNNQPVLIYDMTGRLIRRTRVAEGTTSLPLRPGIYIIKAGDKAFKVIVSA